ncbi:MAG: hypothetical protein LBG48_06020 [Rickettsiales bacterium]|jgi:hypothetical protein|nr:hypothetical protein [Rickettsiales bacterium]
MKFLINSLETLTKAFTSIKSKGFLKEYILLTEEIKPKRSKKQLRAYWRLIEVIRSWMNKQDKDNCFTKEEVSDYFKILAGFYKEKNGIKLAKSISDKSDCTKEDMKIILNNMLEFGKQFNIRDCFLFSAEWDEIMSNFPEK